MPSPGNVQNSCEFSGLNQGPLDLQSNALPTELRRQMSRNGEKETIRKCRLPGLFKLVRALRFEPGIICIFFDSFLHDTADNKQHPLKRANENQGFNRAIEKFWEGFGRSFKLLGVLFLKRHVAIFYLDVSLALQSFFSFFVTELHVRQGS